jgi:8-oxo-dGTP pyrophosphatase MutT (NUDIX family)
VSLPLPPSGAADAAGLVPGGDIVALVRGLADGTITAAAARPAATVMLLRDGAEGPEVYLLRRAPTMAFAAGMTVFPGGRVDPRDGDLPDAALPGCDLDAWSRLLGGDRRLTAALVCAAVRETFEESGVLLAGPDAGSIVEDTAGPDWETDRVALVGRELAFAEFLTRRGLVLRGDLLRPWAHWITPEVEPRRYDTRFFVAAMPPGQLTRDVGGEADRVSWQTPQAALAAADRGEAAILPPTAFALTELAAYPTVAAVLEAGTARDIRPVLPRVVVDGDQVSLLLHDQPEG